MKNYNKNISTLSIYFPSAPMPWTYFWKDPTQRRITVHETYLILLKHGLFYNETWDQQFTHLYAHRVALLTQ